jgi:uncharacterized DUF497 family protein
MPFYFFIWDEENERHIAEHGVRPVEFEEVVCDPDEVRRSRTTGRRVSFGLTTTGRYLLCVYEFIDDDTIYPITAFDVEE